MVLCSACRIGGPNAGLEPLEGTELSFCTCCAAVVRDMAALFERRGASLDEIVAEITKRFLPRMLEAAIIQNTGRVAELEDAPGYKPAPEDPR